MRATVGTAELVRLGVRRDRIFLPAWVYVLVGLAASTALAFKQLYPTRESRLPFAAGIAQNPTLHALTGPTFDLTTIGGLTAWRLGALGGALIGLMNVFAVVRHTRAEEEAGRLELIGSCVVGRRAPLTAALAIAWGADVLVGALVAALLVLTGQPLAGSVALGFGLAAVGAAFAGLAAATAQLTEGARAASGLAAGAVGVSYLLRALGDSAAPGGPTWLSWVSPIGWGQQVRPFAGERWWVLALPLALAAVTTAAAYALVGRRDHGAGLLPARPGPATAAARLRGPLSLAWRLQRGTLLGWLAGFAVFGGVIGGIAQDLGALVNTSQQIRQIMAALGGSKVLVDSFIAAMLGLMGLLAAVYTVAAVLRLRGEETGQRAEPVLATRVGRIPYAASHLTVAALGGALLLVVGGAVTGVAHGLRSSDLTHQFPRVFEGALVQVPAAWVLAGIAVALFGLAPRLSAAAWGVVVAFLLLGQLGPTLGVPQWALDVSPFSHVPKLPGGTVTATPLVWLLVVGVVLAAAGLVGFRRRDVG